MGLPLRTQRPQWPFPKKIPKLLRSSSKKKIKSWSRSYSLSWNVWIWNKDNSNLIKNTPYHNSWQKLYYRQYYSTLKYKLVDKQQKQFYKPSQI